MKKLLVIPLIILYSCAAVPPNFYPCHTPNADTGLSRLIDIDGYYVAQHGCDSTFFSVFMFYSDGLFTIATTSEITDELASCFEKGGQSNVCKYPLWGTYTMKGDTIETQAIRPEGGGCIIFRDYLILDNRQIVNISDYVDSQYTLMGYMKNHPSFWNNNCKMPAQFYKTKTKRSPTDCPFLNKKWFFRSSDSK